MKSSTGEWVRFEATALEPRVCAWRASRTHERERQCPGDPLLSHGLDWRVHVGLLPGSICGGMSSTRPDPGCCRSNGCSSAHHHLSSTSSGAEGLLQWTCKREGQLPAWGLSGCCWRTPRGASPVPGDLLFPQGSRIAPPMVGRGSHCHPNPLTVIHLWV